MSTKKSENAFKHPQQQVQSMEFNGDEQRRQQTSCNTTNVVVEESTNGCVTLTALEKEQEVEEIDEVEQHTQMTTYDTYISKEKSNVNATELAVTPAAVMVMNDAPEPTPTTTLLCGKKLLFCRRFKDYGGILCNFNSLPLFVYATSPSTHAISADGVGVAKEAVAAADAICQKNDSYDLALCPTSNSSGFGTATAIIGAMECLPIMNGGGSSSNSSGLGTLGIGGAHHIMSSGNSSATVLGGTGGGGGSTPTVTVVGSYQQHLTNLHAAHHPHLNLIGHHHAVTPYSNNYPLHHSSSHHHIQSEQTKSLQELQHEVGALLEFRDLVIETFPDLKHKMASMSSSSTATSTTTAAAGGNSVTGANTLTGGGGGGGSVSGGLSNASLVSRREWEPGIRLKRKVSQKEPSTATASATVTVNPAAVVAGVAAGELSSSSLTRSRSNSHSGKKEPKSGENNNGSVVQDSGFSTETSSSKEGHSASSTNGAMTGPAALNRLSCHESDDELMNLLDVIHRKSSRLREEMDQLQRYERQNLRGDSSTINANNNSTNPTTDESTRTVVEVVSTPVTTRSSSVLAKSSSSGGGGSSNITVNGAGLTPKTFREHVERLNKEDIKQLRKERDRLLDKLAEMEAETLTGRIKAAKMNDQVEELISVKKDLEEQLKLAMAQKLDLSARVQQLQQQQQQQQLQSKSSSSQSDYSSQRNFLSSAATTVLSTGSTASVQLLDPTTNPNLSTQATAQSRRQHTFQPVVVVDGLQQPQQHQRLFHPSPTEDIHNAFHQSAGSDNKSQQSEQSESQQQQQQQRQALGRLDGIVSQPGGRLSKCRMIDSKRFAAILLETSVVELQRHLLTLTVQNQVLMQKLDSATKSKSHLAKRLDKSKDDVEDLRFQLEEKNIELEGTKAQLRVLESRIHSVTPSSGAPTNSYLHSQNDYETNRSSASTTLMLSRRGISDIQYSDMRSATPISETTATATTTTNAGQMPAPPLTQISTPSMKAMVHLPMDELQQHSSSTESAHDHELHESGEHAQTGTSSVNRLMSASVGSVSPFDSVLRGKKVSMGSKPSKIPLPGSKAAAYFAGKPPSGRPSTAGRSPPSTHTYAASNSSSKSSLCRSTGNLLYSKSPNSLKSADSAQSIRKDNSSLSTNTSRSSTSSSIPLATHHLLSNATSKSPIGASGNTALTPTPSPRILQNSPLPKLKRESLTSRVRHLDSLSRVHQHNQNQHSNISNGGGGGSDVSCTSPTSNNQNNFNSSLLISSSSPTSTTTQSYIVSSTPKPSAIAAHLNATLRKDLQLNTNSYGAQQFLRRATGGGGGSVGSANSSSTSVQSVVNNSATARRFSSASVVGARIANRSQSQDAGSGEQAQQQQTSDSDSGKHSLLYELLPCIKTRNSTINSTTITGTSWRQQQWQQVLTQALHNQEQITELDVELDGALAGCGRQSATTFALRPLQYQQTCANLIKSKDNCNFVRAYEVEEQIKLQQQQHEKKINTLLEEASSLPSYDYYYSNDSVRSSDRGSDNILVTFDYGFSDSLLEEVSMDDISMEKKQKQLPLNTERHVYPIKEEDDDEVNVWLPNKNAKRCSTDKYADDAYSASWEQQDDDEEDDLIDEKRPQIWFNTALTRSQNEESVNTVDAGGVSAFKVHHMQHQLMGNDVDQELDVDGVEAEESLNSSLVALTNTSSENSRSATSASSFYYQHLGQSEFGVRQLVAETAETVEKTEVDVESLRDNKKIDTAYEVHEFFDSLN